VTKLDGLVGASVSTILCIFFWVVLTQRSGCITSSSDRAGDWSPLFLTRQLEGAMVLSLLDLSLHLQTVVFHVSSNFCLLTVLLTFELLIHSSIFQRYFSAGNQLTHDTVRALVSTPDKHGDGPRRHARTDNARLQTVQNVETQN
jgi:hypothetical protein